jgi:predicted transcriptional regulator
MHAETFHLTSKQAGIIAVMFKLNEDGSFLDIDQLLDRLPYETTKQSLQFSLRALVKHGLAEKKGGEVRRGRRRVIWGPTALGLKVYQGIDVTQLGFPTPAPKL